MLKWIIREVPSLWYAHRWILFDRFDVRFDDEAMAIGCEVVIGLALAAVVLVWVFWS